MAQTGFAPYRTTRLEWERVKGFLEPALGDTHTLDDVYEEIVNHRAELWPLPNGALVTQVASYPRKRVLRVWLAGGDLDEFKRGVPFLDDIARELGCDGIEIEGRKGWERVLMDYTVKSVFLTKDVD